MLLIAASRWGPNIHDRPRADLESGLGASPRGFESRILRQLENWAEETGLRPLFE